MAKFSMRELGKRYKTGKVVFSQGDPADTLFVVQKGRVEIVLETANGEIPLTVHEKNDVFGEVALFANKTHFTTARALEETQLLCIDETTFISKLHQDPSLTFRVVRGMANRLYDLHHEMIQRQYHQQFAPEPALDRLTGLPAIDDAEELLETAVTRSRRMLQTLAYATLDIDHLKALREQYGVDLQDRLLLTLAALLQKHLRKSDTIGRLGRDRFSVLLYEADGEAARRVLEKVRQVFEQTVHPVNGASVNATFSVGIAAFPDHGSAAELRAAANQALSAAKDRGHNQVMLARPGFLLEATV